MREYFTVLTETKQNKACVSGLCTVQTSVVRGSNAIIHAWHRTHVKKFSQCSYVPGSYYWVKRISANRFFFNYVHFKHNTETSLSVNFVTEISLIIDCGRFHKALEHYYLTETIHCDLKNQ